MMGKRIYTLDVLRGLAALSVVFWHWQHFFYKADHPEGFEVIRQPFYSVMSIFYRYGALAVELFFCISGFVFFFLYFHPIAKKNLAIGRFFIDRFSRLYPLHLVTFILVFLLQVMYLESHSSYFVYQYNDVYHALLNILLIPAWGWERGWSFNGPVWSVSVEVFLYAIFFLVCLTGRFRYSVPFLIVIAAYMAYPYDQKVATGMFAFFAGGIGFLILDRVQSIFGEGITCTAMLALAAIAWVVLWLVPGVNLFILMGLAFPLSVMFCASLSLLNPNLLKSLAFIGDLSYSSYLLHFPLQIIFALSADQLGYGRDVFYRPEMFVLFMSALILLSFACHHLLEMPVQTAIRGWYLGRKLNSIR